MSTNDPEFYQAPKFTPEPPQPLPKQRGCFFYGCIIASILAVLMAIVLGVGLYFGYRLLNRYVEDFTSTKRLVLPTVEMPPEKLQTLKDRVEAFRKAVDDETPTEPLILTADDLNALINEDEDLKGKVYVKIDGDEVKGQVSIPLEVPMLRGRFLNGEAELKASLRDGVLIVTLDAIEVNGKRPPEEMMSGLRQQNLAKDAYKNKKYADMLRKLESLEVKDGTVILRVRAKGASGAAPKSSDTKKDVPVEVVPSPSKVAAPKSEPAKPAEPPKTAAPTPKKS